MKRSKVSDQLNYQAVFESWEVGVAKGIVREFCGDGKPFPRDEFDDLLQEVLTHWFFRKGTYDSTHAASPRTYMSRLVRRKLIDLLEARETDKRKTLNRALSMDAPVSEDNDAPTLGELIEAPEALSPKSMELRLDISLALRKLSPRQRTILQLKARGVENTEISGELGVHRDTIQADIRRIRKLFTNAGLEEYLQ